MTPPLSVPTGQGAEMSFGVRIRRLCISPGKSLRYVAMSDMHPADAQRFGKWIAPCACPTVEGEQAFYLHDWERWNRAENEEAASPHKRPRMTTLQAYAAHGSVSYGEISAERFAEIVKGDVPTTGERVSVCQGLTEMHAASINGNSADELAAELGMARADIEARCRELCGVALGAHAFPTELPKPPQLTPDS